MKMDLKRALEVFEYNKAMLTCDMSIHRDPEHQDVSPDYYGKDAEDLYYAIVCAEEYIKNAIPVEWFKKKMDWYLENAIYGAEVYQWVLNRWYEDKENWEKRK